MTNALPYHVGPEERYSLSFVNPDRGEFEERLAETAMKRGSAVKAREVAIDGDEGVDTLYAVYEDSVPESLLGDRSSDDIERILDAEFTDEQVQVLEAILELMGGAIGDTSRTTAYKEMDLPKIPEILDYPDWGAATVPEVAGQLLSRFILAHPLPNANHRTAIGLVEWHLQTNDETVTVPDTGENGVWYDWAEPYVLRSKRLLTVRRKAHVFRYARDFGVDVVRRRNDVDVDLHGFALDVDDPLEHFAAEHESESIDFVRTILDVSDATELEGTTDRGWENFVRGLQVG